MVNIRYTNFQKKYLYEKSRNNVLHDELSFNFFKFRMKRYNPLFKFKPQKRKKIAIFEASSFIFYQDEHSTSYK